MKNYNIGIDIGSTSTKTAVLNENFDIKEKFLYPTGWSGKEISKKIFAELNSKGYDKTNSKIVATGYGRICADFADKCKTEITCHGKGANFLFDEKNLLIIDIGGQDTKIIKVENNAVVDFLMNDKCSAGTGRFLEVMSNVLGVSINELCEMASYGSNTHINCLCTVFAESEVISLIGRGEKRENIAYGIVYSIIEKVSLQVRKLMGNDIKMCLTGGLSSIPYIKHMFENELNTKILSNENGRYAGAIGAALLCK